MTSIPIAHISTWRGRQSELPTANRHRLHSQSGSLMSWWVWNCSNIDLVNSRIKRELFHHELLSIYKVSSFTKLRTSNSRKFFVGKEEKSFTSPAMTEKKRFKKQMKNATKLEHRTQHGETNGQRIKVGYRAKRRAEVDRL